MKRGVDLLDDATGVVVDYLQDEELLTAVPSLNVMHPTQPVIVSATGSGRVVVWRGN